MKVRLLLFGAAAESAGPVHEGFELPDGARAGDVADAFRRSRPDVAGAVGPAAVAVNRRYAKADAPLSEGDEVALIPPVSGG